GSFKDMLNRIVLFVVNVMGWFYTLSIGSWLGVGVGILFAVFMKPKKRMILAFIIAVVGISLLASPSANQRFHTFWRMLKGEINPIDMERVYAWQSIVRMLKDRPVFGVGVENFDIAYPQYKMPKAHLYMLEAHNLYLHLAACTGWIGLGIFLVLWVWIFRDGVLLFNRTRDSDIKRWTLGLLMMWVVINVHGMVTYSFYDRQVATLIWSFLALLEVLGEVDRGDKKARMG
ncbi:MAG: O-antigen ligase family protein, partial [Synergistetes bacterium]|nr:O-antigen ligase family protein [Synergistota bacterium]